MDLLLDIFKINDQKKDENFEFFRTTGRPDKAHYNFFIFMFFQGTMYMSVIFFENFVSIKLTFMTGINRKKIVFSTFIPPIFSRLFDPGLNVKT